MEYSDYPLICHWGGHIIEGNGDVSYEGGENCFVLANTTMSYNDLVNHVSVGVQCDLGRVELKLKMKYPTLGSFRVMSLSDDRSLRALWAGVRYSSAPSMDLYVEIKEIQSSVDVGLRAAAPLISTTPLRRSRRNAEMKRRFVSVNSINPDEEEADREGGGPVSSVVPTPVRRSGRNAEVNHRFVSMNSNNLDAEQADREAEGIHEEVIADNKATNEDSIGSDVPTSFSLFNTLDESRVDKWKRYILDDGDEFRVGQEFASKACVSEAVAIYSTQRNQLHRVAESKPSSVTFKCGRKPIGCTWRLKATQKDFHSNVFTVIIYKGPHGATCLSDPTPEHHVSLDSKIISRHIRNLVEADPSIRVRAIVEVVRKRFKCGITYKKAWLARQRAITDVFGNWDESVKLLPQFMQAMKEFNPGTVVHFTNHETTTSNIQKFQRVFWAFGPCIDGFNHCRPLITIDGIPLYGKHEGTLLYAMGTDANNQLFPLAFAIVEDENDSSWAWFLSCLRRFVTQRTGLCVVSDQHPGIVKAMNEAHSGWEEPCAFHRLCIRHLASDLSTQFKFKELEDMFGWTAQQHQDKKFTRGLNRIREMNIEAHQYLSEISQCHWSFCHDGGVRYGIKTTNSAEVLNNLMKGARFLPVMMLVKLSFDRVSAYFLERFDWAQKRVLEGHIYSERITKALDRNAAKSAHHRVQVLQVENGIYRVQTGGDETGDEKVPHIHIVDLDQKTCTCKKVQIYKYPCSHVLAVCNIYLWPFDQFVDSFYSSREYMETYRGVFHPIPDKDNWTSYTGPTIVVDEKQKRGGGRPKLKKEMDSGKAKITCGICRQTGHNKKSCPSKRRITTTASS